MTTPAVVMLIVAVCMVWGGFAAAVLHLRRVPEAPDEAPDEARDHGPGDHPRTT